MTITRAGLLAAAALLCAPAAMAQSYPRVTGTGENMMIDYGPMGSGALVGGGRVIISTTPGMNVDFIHLDTMFAQQPREGFVPVTVGSGENAMVVYIPAAMAERMRAARSAMPAR